MVIVLEFRKRKQFVPVILPLVDEDAKVLFQFLVNLFCLSVALWVVSHSGCQFDPKKSV